MSERNFGSIGMDYQTIFDASLDATFILDANGQILNANRTAVQRYGYSLDELKQRSASDLAARDLIGEVPARFGKLLKAGEIFEWRHRCKDGSELPVEISSEPILLGGKRVILSRVRDISRRKLLESELQQEKHLLDRILETEPGSVYIYDLSKKQNVYVNRHWLIAFGYTAEETQAMGAELLLIFHRDDLPRIAAHHDAWREASDGETRTIEYRVRDREGDWHWLLSRETPFKRDGEGKVSQILGIADDITERKRAELLLGGQNHVLEMIAAGAPLAETLTRLIRLIEAQSPGMLGSVLLLDKDGVHVRHCAAPNLPAEFVAAVDGQPIGPSAGSCGTAAYRREAVFVEDIATDPLWAKYKAAALPHGLRASWSTPVFDAQGRVLGTFALYYRQPGLPKPEHLRLIAAAVHLAAVAISHSRADQELRESEEKLRLFIDHAPSAIAMFDREMRYLAFSRRWLSDYGLAERELAGRSHYDVFPDIPERWKAVHRRSLAGETAAADEDEFVRRDGSVDWVRWETHPWWNREGGIGGIIIFSEVITKRKIAEARVQRLSQLYAALSQCNQAIVRCSSEAELLPQICRDAVNFGGMKMAWIGMADEAGKRVTPVASFGTGTEYLDELNISIAADVPAGSGPTGTAIRENRPFWCQDFQHDPATAPWRAQGAKFGWGASASLPLHRKGLVIGSFTLYTHAANAFDESAQDLLVEMALDISFALDRFASEDERKRAEEALRVSEQRLRTIVETEPEGVMVIDRNGKLLEMNAAGLAMLELASLDEAREHDFQNSILPEYRDAYLSLHQRVMNGETATLEFEVTGRKGSRRRLETHAAPMHDADGRVSTLLGITRDISERRRAEERIQYLANFDVLTGLPNRLQLADHLKYALSLVKRGNGHLAVLFIDIDRFKDINDTLGHSVGDALLVKIAKRIHKVLREEDTASRLGGDEFILMFPGCDAQGASQVAQKLLQVIAEPYRIEEFELAVTASIGIAIFPEDGVDLESLSKSADTAMYRVKQEGRDGYRFFTAEMQARATRNMQLVNALRNALLLDQFRLHYQTQVSISDGRIVGTEALLRWTHPELGPISPSEFIPVAEDCGLILPIGEWVLRTAVTQLKRWLDRGHPPMVMAVNLSAVQFRHPRLPDLVSRILDEAQLPAEYLELELTEGVAMHDPQGAISVMNNLHDRGIRMSIDDFGTGYSSLSYLKKFRVYKLKIDQSFVRDINTDLEDKAIVAAVISMANSLGLQTIAEGVETAEQLQFLREHGCNEAQGYYFSKPLPADQIEALFIGPNA